MASYTLLQVLLDTGAVVDQDGSTTPSGTELTNQVSYADRAQRDWYEFYDWPETITTQTPTVTISQTSIGLPAKFDRLVSPVYDYSPGLDSPAEYIQLGDPRERFQKFSTDKYVYVVGNDLSGRALVINPALASGASIVFDIRSTPSSLATTTDTVTCPNRSFMSSRIEYYRLLARSDSRFPQMKADSEQILSNMIEKKDTPSGAQNNRIPTYLDRKVFRIGGS